MWSCFPPSRCGCDPAERFNHTKYHRHVKCQYRSHTHWKIDLTRRYKVLIGSRIEQFYPLVPNNPVWAPRVYRYSWDEHRGTWAGEIHLQVERYLKVLTIICVFRLPAVGRPEIRSLRETKWKMRQGQMTGCVFFTNTVGSLSKAQTRWRWPRETLVLPQRRHQNIFYYRKWTDFGGADS